MEVNSKTKLNPKVRKSGENKRGLGLTHIVVWLSFDFLSRCEGLDRLNVNYRYNSF